MSKLTWRPVSLTDIEQKWGHRNAEMGTGEWENGEWRMGTVTWRMGTVTIVLQKWQKWGQSRLFYPN